MSKVKGIVQNIYESRATLKMDYGLDALQRSLYPIMLSENLACTMYMYENHGLSYVAWVYVISPILFNN